MTDLTLQQPSKTVPVVVGGLAMAATAVIPFLNVVNCLCCAGIMGGAILGVWMYKKNFPAEMPFTVGDGTIIGVLSGLVGAVVTAVIESLQFGLMSGGMDSALETQLEEAIQQMEAAGQDPATVEAARDFIMQFATNPMLAFVGILVASLFIFAAFGALGGVIGGNIFKTKTVLTPPAT